jgi:molecular chaperone DnaK
MRKEAESHAGETKHRVEVINARNEAEHHVYQIEKLLKEHGDKISASDKSAIESAVARVKEVAKGDDAAAIKREVEALNQASQAMAQHLYGQAGAGAGAGPSPDGAQEGGGPGKGEDVQDAEFEVKK